MLDALAYLPSGGNSIQNTRGTVAKSVTNPAGTSITSLLSSLR